MRLNPREQEALLLHQVGFVAQKRLARGCKLNFPEAVALLSNQIVEFARDGLGVSELVRRGKQMLGRNQVMEGVEYMIKDVHVEATFPDGTKMVAVDNPICRSDGDLELALYGSFLPVPGLEIFCSVKTTDGKGDQVIDDDRPVDPPGFIYPLEAKDIEINRNKQKVVLEVTNVSDRPIQVASHYNFLEVNRNLILDRKLSYGMRLNIPAGTAIRFEPGEKKAVPLVEIGGRKVTHGGNYLADGPVDKSRLPEIMQSVQLQGFGNVSQTNTWIPKTCSIPRHTYAKMYGPTTGDKIKLGDTSLIIEIMKDYAVYGDECIYGPGKVLRAGMGMCSEVSCMDVPDTVITNCVIVDAIQGIIKADVAIKDGKICGIGKSGNPDTMDDITPGMVFGTGTDVISAEGLILTAGGIDSHVHFICPQLVQNSLVSGITTMIGGGTGPSTGTYGSTCSSGVNHIQYIIESTDSFPMNFGFTGKGNTSNANALSEELIEQITAGAIGLKIHEDWGATPATIDTALSVADKYDVQILIHTDGMNESSCVEDTVKAFKGRTIHTYHTEGAGGGHAPDIIKVCGEENVLPSSTTPTLPFTINTVEEHFDMLMTCHHLKKHLKEDIAFTSSRIRPETIASEAVLHDMGAISMMSSDSQAMGRISEVITRTWQTADRMRQCRGRLPNETGLNDNFRVMRFIAKYTINPAITHGISNVVGSIEIGKLADLVLWNPMFFGTKPNMVIKGGQIACSEMGNPNASIPTVQPVTYKNMFGAFGKSPSRNSFIFVSKLSFEKGIVQKYRVEKEIIPVSITRNLKKTDMVHNDFLPRIKVDPESFKVFIMEKDGEAEKWRHITCKPAYTLPLTQRYFLF